MDLVEERDTIKMILCPRRPNKCSPTSSGVEYHDDRGGHHGGDFHC